MHENTDPTPPGPPQTHAQHLDKMLATIQSIERTVQEMDERRKTTALAVDTLLASHKDMLGIIERLLRRIETLEKAHDQRVSLHQLR